MLNDLFILTQIKEGNIKTFEEVFRRYYSPLCWYAAGITGEMETAEIASSLSLSVKTVEAEMTKALRTLRNEIDSYIQMK